MIIVMKSLQTRQSQIQNTKHFFFHIFPVINIFQEYTYNKFL